MTTSKINIGLALSRNYDKVNLEMVDEPIEHETEEGFRIEVQKRFKVIREEIIKEYKNIQK